MTRLFAILIAVGFLSVSQVGNSYADSDHDDDKYEQKHEQKHENDDDREKDGHASKSSAQPRSHNGSGNPVSQSLDAVSNSVNKAAHKINQAKEWWQFW